MIIIITIITLLLYQLQYYSHWDYKFWQYYAKYAYHADKLSRSHSCLLETFGISFKVNSRGGEGHAPIPLSYHLCSHVSQPKIGQVEMLRFKWIPVVTSRAYFFYPPTTQKAPWSRIVLAFVWTTAYLCIPGQLSIGDSMDTVKISKRFACANKLSKWHFGKLE